ncbi:Transport system permease protein [Sterolibacterium denitrificans]|uniref:Transport system permease protein n=1 Tax=Sterolibacterium denitrificans TaxID=157592 RepID=A0A7Z7HT10_9PROT|nr:iron ABC transporter permease [Sterolibacterium denitrificans]SMB28673.1 Transport system permease protein [Sterolibacterium denitrificans]
MAEIAAPSVSLSPSPLPRAARLRHPAWRWLVAPMLMLVALLAALSLGRYPLPPGETLRFVLAALGLVSMEAEQYVLLHNLIVEIRLPRILAAILVGASLSVSGAAYQALFRNPLVSPGLLGVLAGAAAGAAFGIVMGGSWLVVQTSAFLCGLAAVGVGVGIAHLFGGSSLIMLVLGGILSGALFTSVLSMLKYLADPDSQLPAIVYWLMGSLGQANLDDMTVAAVPLCLGIAVLCLMGRALDALAMGDDEARTLGIPVAAVRLITIAAATLISALTVSIAGMIGWIGLIVPHIARLLVGPGNARLLPAAAFLGAAFLLSADSLARNAFAAELPIGIVTELLGIPVFMIVLSRVRRGWST